MATYQSTRAIPTQSAKYLPGIVVDDCEFDLTAALALNDVIQLFKIPAGAKMLDFMIDIPKLDSNATPTVELDLGDTANAENYYVAASTKGQNAAIMSSANDMKSGTVGTYYSADDVLALTVHTAPATGETTGKLRAWVMYTIDESAV